MQDIATLIREFSNAGASIASIIVLAYLLLQFSKVFKEHQKSIDANTEATNNTVNVTKSLQEAVDGLKEVIGGCANNRYNRRDNLKKS